MREVKQCSRIYSQHYFSSFFWIEHWLIIQDTLFLKWFGKLGVLCIVAWCRPQ
jgi:hypothetical protein